MVHGKNYTIINSCCLINNQQKYSYLLYTDASEWGWGVIAFFCHLDVANKGQVDHPYIMDISLPTGCRWFYYWLRFMICKSFPSKNFPLLCIYIMITWISSPFIYQSKQITLVLLVFKSKLLLLVIHVKRLILPQKSLNDCFTIPRINACYVHVHAWKLYLITLIIIHLPIH